MFHTVSKLTVEVLPKASLVNRQKIIRDIRVDLSSKEKKAFDALLVNFKMGVGPKTISKLRAKIAPKKKSSMMNIVTVIERVIAISEISKRAMKFLKLVEFLDSLSLVEAEAILRALEGKYVPMTRSVLLRLISGRSDFVPTMQPSNTKKLYPMDHIIRQRKYDGERLQIHFFPDKDPEFYSRSGKSANDRFGHLFKGYRYKHTVIDSEIVAIDSSEVEKHLPSSLLRGDTSVKVFAFDLLFHLGEDIRSRPLGTRWEILNSFWKDKINLTELLPTDITEKALLKIIKRNHWEGYVEKDLRSEYKSGRTTSWKKIKPEADTLDVAVIGALPGKGKHKGRWGSFLCAILSKDKSEFIPIAKVGTGFSDKDREMKLEEVKAPYLPVMKKELFERKGWHGLIWLSGREIWEIKYTEISKSPLYPLGISLRFPAFVKKRPDKDYPNINEF